MSIVDIVSAIGNNSGIYPLLVRDCGIENLTKVTMTYSQNRKVSKKMARNATRERFIDEYGTSAVWLGGIPLMNKICDFGIKKLGYNPDISPDFFKENNEQGLKFNINKFKEKMPEEIKEMEKILKNKKRFEKLLGAKFVLSTAIPTLLMGFVLPKLNFGLTDKINKTQVLSDKASTSEVSFKGVSSVMANMSTVNKMAITDCGLTVGRVDTARNKNEKIEMAFKMGMMMILNYVFPSYLAKWLDTASDKIFGINVNLDPKLLNDKNFVSDIEKGKINCPKENFIEYLDKNPDSVFAKLAEKYAGVKYLKNRVRDPRQYIDTARLKNFVQELENFSNKAKSSGDVKKYAKKALVVKSINILSNICISSFLLAAALPKVTFILRKKFMGFDAEPGLVDKIK